MKGEVIKCIYSPINTVEWVVIETDKSFFSLRLGGFKKETGFEDFGYYISSVLPYSQKKIKEVYTDDEWVYILLEGTGVIASGWTEINLLGEMKLGIKFTEIEEYDPNFFESICMSKLVLDSDGWSKKIQSEV